MYLHSRALRAFAHTQNPLIVPARVEAVFPTNVTVT